ncbi:hypothetical protein TELCIR_24006, partial [Teladorsagia circumcincta]
MSIGSKLERCRSDIRNGSRKEFRSKSLAELGPMASGCGWDATLVKCTDALGLCKGGCRDFAVSASATLHDC